MTGLIAHNALLVSVAVIAFGAIITPIAIRSGRRDWLQLTYGAVYTNFALVSLATALMIFVRCAFGSGAFSRFIAITSTRYGGSAAQFL